MGKTLIQCPSCKTRFKVYDLEDMDGEKVVCKKCRTPFRIHLPRPILGSLHAQDEFYEVGADAIIDDESPAGDDTFDLAGADLADEPEVQAVALLGPSPLRKKKSAAKKPSATAEQPDAGKPRPPAKTGPSVMVIAAAIAGSLLFVGVVVGGIFALRGAGSKKFQAPEKFVEFKPRDFALSCTVPEGWEQKFGGGMGGGPVWASFTRGNIVIEIRESISGGALGQAAIAMSQKHGSGDDPDLAPVQGIHESQKMRFAENFDSYQEGPAQPIKTGFGDSRIADFSAGDGFFKTPVKGCRATMLNSIHQFTVSCKCPPAIFKEARPVFVRVVESIAGGTGQ